MIPNLLVTDDDAALRGVLCETLSRSGFRVLEAADGDEALDVLRVRRVHFALVDVHMPRVTGLDVLKRLTAMTNVPPCVLMSADLNDSIVREAERMKAYRVLSKPIRAGQVREVVFGALADVYGWKESALFKNGG